MNGAEPTHADLLLQERGRRRYRAIVESLGGNNRDAVLDLGCGEGNLATMISEGGLELRMLVGLDLDRSKLLKAVGKTTPSGRVGFIRGDAENRPLAAGGVPVACATEVRGEHAACR